MKLAAKPISSPGRTEKFPPPLMRFLRTNVGSKSRGRSRSSPMFVRRKNNSSAAIETQEPSSPKVTCMGQVRVKRSSKQTSSSRPKKSQQPSCRCQWIPRRVLFCPHFPGKITRPKLCRTVWSRWASFFQLSFRRKVGIGGEHPAKNVGSRFEERSEDSEEEEDDDEEEEKERERETDNKLFISSLSPPKNALLLTRCRSAPYRSSSLACRFWGSPLKTEEEEEEEEKQRKEIEKRVEEEEKEQEQEQEEKPSLEMERLSSQEEREDSEAKEKCRTFHESDGSTGKRSSESTNTEEGNRAFSARPLILTRCKSEPARTGEKLNPEMSFWRNRRLGIVNSCSASVL